MNTSLSVKSNILYIVDNGTRSRDRSHARVADGKRSDTWWFKSSYEAWILKGDRLVLVGLNTAQNSFNEPGDIPELLELPMEEQPFFEELMNLIDRVTGSSEGQ